MKKFILALVLCVASGAAYADKVDDYVAAQMEKQHIPGVAIAVIQAGKPVKVQGYGLSNMEFGTQPDDATVFKIGSLSKQFIASAIVLLNGEGKLGLDDPVTRWFPDAPEAWHQITVRHLLTHTSGLTRESPGFEYLKMKSDLEVIKAAYGVPLTFAPGTSWTYCNLGYFMLAEIVHQVSHEPWDKFIAEHIFKPAGMTATHTTKFEAPHRADGYDWVEKDNKFQKSQILIALRPSGSFESDIQDLIKWDTALRTNKVLSQKQQEAMQQPAPQKDGSTKPYGMGWQLQDVNGHRLVHHGGSLAGFRSEMSRFIEDGLTIIVLTNEGRASPDKIALGIAELYNPALHATASAQ